jgi:4-hydroxybenzoate polyprenyltransferase
MPNLLPLVPIWKALRPKQWIKNALLFAGIIFSGHLRDWEYLQTVLFAFLVFCLTASGIYLFNDLADRDRDCFHPEKKSRPVANGSLPAAWALGAGFTALTAGLSAGFWLGLPFGLLLLGYVIANAAYTWKLKSVVILDVFMIALGFLIRAVAGAAVIQVLISPWLLIVTTLFSLLMGFIKRRQELLTTSQDSAAHRPVLADYSLQLLDQYIGIVTSATIMAYSLYAFISATAQNNLGLMLTIPFVLYGLFRYLHLAYQKHLGGAPEQAILQDPALLAAILLWLGTAIFTLYFKF